MKKEKKQIVLNGSLLRPLSVGRGALLHAGGNIYHTSRVVAILEETGYDFDIFGEPGFLWAEVAVDGKEDYKDFMKEWKAGKEAYNQ